jgi:hypothetical protein
MVSGRDEFRAIRAVISNAMAERKRESLAVERAYMERLVRIMKRFILPHRVLPA